MGALSRNPETKCKTLDKMYRYMCMIYIIRSAVSSLLVVSTSAVRCTDLIFMGVAGKVLNGWCFPQPLRVRARFHHQNSPTGEDRRALGRIGLIRKIAPRVGSGHALMDQTVCTYV